MAADGARRAMDSAFGVDVVGDWPHRQRSSRKVARVPESAYEHDEIKHSRFHSASVPRG